MVEDENHGLIDKVQLRWGGRPSHPARSCGNICCVDEQGLKRFLSVSLLLQGMQATLYKEQAFGTVVKTLLGMPTYYTTVAGSSPSRTFPSSQCTFLEAEVMVQVLRPLSLTAEESSRHPGFCLAFAGVWGANSGREDLTMTLFVPVSLQLNEKKSIVIFGRKKVSI